MQTYAAPVYKKNKADNTINKVKPTTFFSTVTVQPKLTIGAVDDPYEREADAMADRVMRIPANGAQQTFFKPAPSIIQRQDDATKTLTEGAGVVKDQLENNPGFAEWKDKQTDALKKKVWDDQPTELKAGIIGFGLSSLGILGSVFATDLGFRADTIKLLNDKNIALPLSLIPYHEYFPLSSFKYKLPSAQGAATGFSTEFEFKPYLDMMHQKWSFIPKTDITLGVDTSYSRTGGFGVAGGSIKIKFGGGIINLQGFVNQTLPATPMLVSGNNPGESPMWIMRTLPGQFDDQLPKGSGVFLTVDVLRLPQLWKGDDKKTDVRRKCAKCEEEDKLQRKESGTNESSGTTLVEQTLQSSGTPLDKGTKSFMEDRFGYDFSNVKIHTDSVAAKSAAGINALAYTSGNNIVFNQNQFSPGTNSGKKLLAHELTHVVQQNNIVSRQVIQRYPWPYARHLNKEVNETVTETISNAPAGSEAWNNTFKWDAHFRIELNAMFGEAWMIVRLSSPAPLAVRKSWERAIERKWSNRMYLRVTIPGSKEGPCKFLIKADIRWVTDPAKAHHTITPKNPGDTCNGRVGLNDTCSMTDWGAGDTTDITHEFGHMLGNPEEYFTTNGHNYATGAKAGFRDPGGGVMNNPAERAHRRHFNLLREHVAKMLRLSTSNVRVIYDNETIPDCAADMGDFPEKSPSNENAVG